MFNIPRLIWRVWQPTDGSLAERACRGEGRRGTAWRGPSLREGGWPRSTCPGMLNRRFWASCGAWRRRWHTWRPDRSAQRRRSSRAQRTRSQRRIPRRWPKLYAAERVEAHRVRPWPRPNGRTPTDDAAESVDRRGRRAPFERRAPPGDDFWLRAPAESRGVRRPVGSACPVRSHVLPGPDAHRPRARGATCGSPLRRISHRPAQPVELLRHWLDLHALGHLVLLAFRD